MENQSETETENKKFASGTENIIPPHLLYITKYFFLFNLKFYVFVFNIFLLSEMETTTFQIYYLKKKFNIFL